MLSTTKNFSPLQQKMTLSDRQVNPTPRANINNQYSEVQKKFSKHHPLLTVPEAKQNTYTTATVDRKKSKQNFIYRPSRVDVNPHVYSLASVKAAKYVYVLHSLFLDDEHKSEW